MKKGYYYLFYKLYKHYERGPSVWMSDWKASFSLDVLFYSIIFSAIFYYKILFNRNLHISENNIYAIILVIMVGGSNYFIFHHKDQWKHYVHEFDKWPKDKNRKASLIAWSAIILIIANFIFSICLL